MLSKNQTYKKVIKAVINLTITVKNPTKLQVITELKRLGFNHHARIIEETCRVEFEDFLKYEVYR